MSKKNYYTEKQLWLAFKDGWHIGRYRLKQGFRKWKKYNQIEPTKLKNLEGMLGGVVISIEKKKKIIE